MSSTAQKQDLSDPNVIADFADRVGNERRLIALYLLTVADIRGTSPRVWNAWKAQLLEDLFHATRARLAGTGVDVHARRQPPRAAARSAAAAAALRRADDAERALWAQLDTVYFLRHTADEIAWHARQLHWRVDGTAPVVKARLSRAEAGLQVPSTCPTRRTCSPGSAASSGARGLSILEAKIHTTRHGYALDTFTVHDPANPTRRNVTRSRSSSTNSRRC